MTTRITPTVELEPVTENILPRMGIDVQMSLMAGVINNTGRELAVVTRSGLRFTLPSLRSLPDRSVFFREGFELAINGEVALGPTDEPVSEDRSTAERLVETMRKAMANYPPHSRMRSSRVLHRLTMDAILTAGGTVYVQSLDLVISTQTNRAYIHHPFSVDGTKHAMRALEESDASLRIAMYIVDNRGTRADRYINWHGRILRVPSRQLPSVHDGFYISHPRPSSVGGAATDYVTTFMSVEDAEKQYGLYRTPEEAQTHGFSKEAMERENLVMKREQSTRQWEREETEAERKERQKLENEEFQRRKQELEDKMSWRKDALDFAKFFLGTVTLVAGTCTTIIKLAGTKGK